MRRFAAVMALLLAGCSGSNQATVPADSGGRAAPSVVELTDTESSPLADIELVYPRLILPGRPQAQDRANAAIGAAVEAARRDFTAGVGESPVGFEGKSGLVLTYQTVRLDERVASFRLNFSQYFAGAAHPGAAVVTLNFDPATGARYLLEELFSPEAGHLEALSAHCREVLRDQLSRFGPLDESTEEWIDDGTQPAPENFAAWAIDGSGVQIVFQEYQVGPYAIGTPQCHLPADKLAPLVAPEGPLAQVALRP
ncbi:MAG: DUF3298 domain-containing protein [Actinomycetota bacterium]